MARDYRELSRRWPKWAHWLLCDFCRDGMTWVRDQERARRD